MDRYQNRQAAGKILAEQLSAYRHQQNVLVLALPRGGVPVAFEIAQYLKAPLDLLIVRKLGVPGHSELALGAITQGATVFNEEIIRDLQISQQEIEPIIMREQVELARRDKLYRQNRPFPHIKNKIIILVDDGIATGATMRAAVKSLQILQPEQIIIAIPVADKNICNEFKLLVDEVVCPLQPTNLTAVGNWYDDFAQTEDEEVGTLLKAARHEPSAN